MKKLIEQFFTFMYGFIFAAFLFIGFPLMLASCTKNESVKNYGGKTTVTLPPNQKLINITWKDANIWILTRQMTASDSVQTYEFTEKSKYGLMEGKIVIVESKSNKIK